MQAEALKKIQATWRVLAGSDQAFRSEGLLLHIGEHRIAPPGYVGVVCLEGSTVIAVRPALASLVDGVDFARVDGHALTRMEGVTAVFGAPVATLGPAILAFTDVAAGPVEAQHRVVGPLGLDDTRAQQVITDATSAEIDESALQEFSAGVYVAVDEAGVGRSVCGAISVNSSLAHMGVLSAASARGAGYAAAAARVVMDIALGAGLIPQWRAAESNVPSVALASSLGLDSIGRQFSFKPVTAS